MSHTLVPVSEVRSTMSTITMLIIAMASTFLMPFVIMVLVNITMVFFEMPWLVIAMVVIGPRPIMMLVVMFIMMFVSRIIVSVLVTDRNIDRFTVVMWLVMIMTKNVIIQADG
jgi:hypothetical protein